MTTELLLIAFIAAVMLIAMFMTFTWGTFSDTASTRIRRWVDRLPDKALLVALIGALIGSLAWAVRRLIGLLTSRAQLGILEALSKNGPLSRTELQDVLADEHYMLRVATDVQSDALVGLVTSGRVIVVEAGKYSLVGKKTAVVVPTELLSPDV